jgi:cytidylate kinase
MDGLAGKSNAVIVCVCGLAGSGKSTLAMRLAGKYGLRYFSGGDALRALAIDEGYGDAERGWWESSEGMRFLRLRVRDSEFDRAIDGKLLEFAREGNTVLDSWTMPWLLDGGFKVWLEASFQKRVQRVAMRDRISLQEASEALKRKESRTEEIYRKLYGFSLGEDFEPFHLVLDTDMLRADEVFSVLCAVMDNYVLRK